MIFARRRSRAVTHTPQTTCVVVADGVELTVPLRAAGHDADGDPRLVAVHPVRHRESLAVRPPHDGFQGTVLVDVIELEA